MRLWLILGALNGLIGLMAAAYGWHALGGNEFMALGSQMQILHGLALCMVAWLADRRGGSDSIAVTVAGFGFLAGIALFSGTLYALALTGEGLFSGAAPAGGFALMLGWLAVIAAALGARS